MKRILATLILLLAISTASADYTVGPNLAGYEWSGNATFDNSTEVQATENVEICGLVDDYISYWRFDQNSTKDENTTSANDGLQQGTTYTTSGKYGGAYTYNNNYINVSSSDSLNSTTQAITIAAWIKTDSGNTYDGICQKGEFTGGHYGAYSIRITDPSTDISCGLNDNIAGAGNVIVSGSWNYVVGTYNKTNITIWVGGIAGNSAAYSSSIQTNAGDLRIGSYFNSYNFHGEIDEFRLYGRALSNSEINQTRDNDHETGGNASVWYDAGSGQETYNLIINCTTPTNTNYTIYYRQNITGNYVLLASAQTGNQTISISGTKYQNTDVRVKLLGNTTETPELLGITFETQTSASTAPTITSHTPTDTIYPEVADSQLFNVTTDQTTNCTWYINGTQVQYNTSATEHAYTNTSLVGGYWNFTVIVNNTNGTDSQTWLFEVGADSITYIVLQDTPTNQSMITEWNVTRIGSNVTDWGIWLNYTFSGWNYTFRYTNGTEIMNQTASSNNESLWFNGTSLLPVGIYFINATSNTNYITLYANEYTLINNWTTDQTYQQIAANISNDVCYSYYNSTSGLWEAYRAGYTYNHDAVIPKNCSVFVFVDAETTISATPNTGGVTIPQDAWFYSYLPGSSTKTLTEIDTAINADGLDVWSLYAFDNATQAYTSTGSYSVDAGEGYAIYCNVTGEWKP